MRPGDSGGPIFAMRSTLINEGNHFKTLKGHEDGVIVGIISFANFSALDSSGVGCIPISTIQDFISNVLANKMDSTKTHYLAMGLLLLSPLLISLKSEKSIRCRVK